MAVSLFFLFRVVVVVECKKLAMTSIFKYILYVFLIYAFALLIKDLLPPKTCWSEFT